MTTVAVLSADLTVNDSTFTSGLKKADAQMMSSKSTWVNALSITQNSFTSVESAVTKLTGAYGLLAGAVAGAATAGFVELAKNALETASSLTNQSTSLGISTTALQKYQFMATQTGLSNEQLITGLTHLNAQIAAGNTPYKTTEEAMNSLAQAIKNAGTQSEKTAIANDGFGDRLGAKFIPALSGGTAGLKAYGDEAERTGNVISGTLIQQSDALNNKIQTLGLTVKNSFESGLLQSFTDASGNLAKVYTDPDFVDGINKAGQAMGSLAAATLNVVSAVGRAIAGYESLSEKVDNYFANTAIGRFNATMNAAVEKSIADAKAREDAAGIDGSSSSASSGPLLTTAGQSGDSVTPYVSSDDIKAQQAAAKAAATLAAQQAKDAADAIDNLKLESDELNNQVSLYGQKAGALDAANTLLKLQNDLAQKGITLTATQQAQVQTYLANIEAQKDKLAELKKAQEASEQADRDRKEAISELGNAFDTAFSDAITGSKKLSDVLSDLLTAILKVITEVTVTKPLEKALNSALGSSSSSGAGDSGGFLSGLFNFLPSFAVGTNNVPQDMIAQIHKGEAIVPAYDADQMRSGGNQKPVTVNIIDNNNNKVTQTQQDTGDGQQINVMIDQMVADNMSRPGTRTAQALKAYSNQSLIRRS